jgi:hypothetical protein
MDLQGKPTFQINECSRCKEWQEDDKVAREKGTRPPCRKCKKGILLYLYVPQGFRALEVDHWHFRAVEGVNGASAVMPALCWDCYIKEWDVKYSKQEDAERPKAPLRLE